MQLPEIVSREEWLAANNAMIVKEKAMMRAGDALAAERRRKPWELVEKDYAFEGPNGTTSLAGLFEGRCQLIVYHHMLKKDDPAPCPGCGMFTDNLGKLVHLNQRDTTLALVARAPLDQIEALKMRLGWTVPFYSTGAEFNADVDVSGGGFGLNVFIMHHGRIYRTYFTTSRGVEQLGSVWSLLDITPFGRQESWEDSPEGTPQTNPYRWWRLNDQYEPKQQVHGCCA
ncbi:DUF899 domain-containing protein [Rhizobium sp. TH2]|uniref:DUF899 domain-containing protein n=1 Tax=Rhizobium sp. TH2 TaxID=2775403 RepID=UPI00215722C4|nr:DUF899 domain-containing protein [Rhizobium sp. TH2]UVC10218.1 DUF899 domain-containing protein [Rhizobium sp. TH2]